MCIKCELLDLTRKYHSIKENNRYILEDKIPDLSFEFSLFTDESLPKDIESRNYHRDKTLLKVWS